MTLLQQVSPPFSELRMVLFFSEAIVHWPQIVMSAIHQAIGNCQFNRAVCNIPQVRTVRKTIHNNQESKRPRL
eukprot:CAMPEP_0172794718 /NCGR_PEP_ID=MMETSP1074-20121228/210120_1 /TAXON_ID=2916 /ORGANISM="Ceratium fusus, Strain PA161109" /LENGTH=72 /DNA_ID=CAMNT_0013631797 /DNA_START=351 /DNA_END=569 /DNA_ORIENTATION=-